MTQQLRDIMTGQLKNTDSEVPQVAPSAIRSAQWQGAGHGSGSEAARFQRQGGLGTLVRLLRERRSGRAVPIRE